VLEMHEMHLITCTSLGGAHQKIVIRALRYYCEDSRVPLRCLDLGVHLSAVMCD
jgi:hypothetical protein